MKKKGEILNQFMTVLIVGAIFAVAICGYFIWAYLAPIGQGIFNEVSNDIIIAVGNDTPSNLSEAVVPQTQYLQKTVNTTEWLGYGFLFAMVFGFIIFAYYQTTKPWMVWIWFFLIFVFVLVAMVLSDAYVDGQTDLQANWEGTDFIMENYPVIIAGVGIFLGILLFIVPVKDSSTEDVEVI